MAAFEVAVVGAGIIGTAIAYECVCRGASVALVERRVPGSGASGMAAGMLAPSSEASGPGAFLRLGLESLALWPEFATRAGEESGIDCELVLDGVLRVALDDSEAEAVQRRARWQKAAGVGVRWVESAALGTLEPGLAGNRGAAWYPAEGHVSSARVLQAIVAASRQRGVAVHTDSEVIALGDDGVRLRGGGSLSAGAVVISAGPWSGGILAGLDMPPDVVRPILGQLIGLHNVVQPPVHVLYAGSRGYALARRDGTVIVGASEEDAGFDTAVRGEVTASLTATARRLLRGAGSAAVSAVWTGLRPATRDGLPVLGFLDSPSAARVVVATGHYRNGVLLAPATARGVAAMALEGVVPAGWEAFAPERFRLR